MKPNLEILKTFTEENLPNLDAVVLGTLEFLSDAELPPLTIGGYEKMLVVGSGNALATGRVLFADEGAIFRDEGTYKETLQAEKGIDAVAVISASGGKHAIGIVKDAIARDLPTYLFTNTEDSRAGALLDASAVTVFPKIREPYTYNTSTYMSMLIAQSGEDASMIRDFIIDKVAPAIPPVLTCYDAFFLIVPRQFDAVREMFRTKFDELFGPELMGRVFTMEQAKHAKTVIPSSTECFISFGEENKQFGNEHNRLHIALPENAGPAAMMAIGYYVIGSIQTQFPPYYKDNIKAYVAETSKMFGQTMHVIVG